MAAFYLHSNQRDLKRKVVVRDREGLIRVA
jgi:hypothetical protein